MVLRHPCGTDTSGCGHRALRDGHLRASLTPGLLTERLRLPAAQGVDHEVVGSHRSGGGFPPASALPDVPPPGRRERSTKCPKQQYTRQPTWAGQERRQPTTALVTRSTILWGSRSVLSRGCSRTPMVSRSTSRYV